MRTVLIIASLWLGLGLCQAEAQVVKDPLLDYYLGHINAAVFPRPPDPDDVAPPITLKTQVFCFAADFTGDGRKSVFITNAQETSGPHGEYAWSVYYPITSGGYRVASGAPDFTAGLNGPAYIGYIDQIKRFGAVIGSKYAVTVFYLDKGEIKIQWIDQNHCQADAEHYPKYFPDQPHDYHITTYTLAQLAQKYAHPDPNNVITPAKK